MAEKAGGWWKMTGNRESGTFGYPGYPGYDDDDEEEDWDDGLIPLYDPYNES